MGSRSTALKHTLASNIEQGTLAVYVWGEAHMTSWLLQMCCEPPSRPPRRYLVSRKEPAPNTECGTLTVYEWGEAAHNEFGQGLLDGVVDQVGGMGVTLGVGECEYLKACKFW